MAPRFIAAQLARPSGFMGIAIRHLMNRHNARMNAFAVRELTINPLDRVLEIGFGGGATLSSLIDEASFVAGIDRSRDVVDWAQRRFSRSIRAGRAEFRHGHVEALPYETAAFDKVCTVNTVYFWKSLDEGFAEIHRVLKPLGKIAVGFLPKKRMDRLNMPEDIFTARTPREVIEALERTGFKDVRIEHPEPETPWNVAVAAR